MASYRYRPLQAAIQEIRFVHLLPGHFKDTIKIRIVHSPFPLLPAPKPKSYNPHVTSLEALVPRPWSIEETERGNLILFNVVTGKTHPIEIPSEVSSEESQEYQPRYEALSYVWGTGNISELAQVEAEHPHSNQAPTTIGIRPNLASALRHLRSVDETRVLWIDAICINQDDISERNEQVKRMTNIYAFAHQVVAWLGEEADNSKHAFATLQHISQQLEATKGGRVIAAPGATEPRLWRNDHAPDLDMQTWQALMQFVQRDWFYRLWCWQEINLAGRGQMQCGSDKIQWNDFWLAILCLNNKDTSLNINFRERCRHIVFLKYGTRGHSMANILDVSRSKGCVNPRDKIYGLLGITASYFSSRITVDYLRPLEDVYKEAFLAHLDVTQRLELLKHCDLTNRQIGGPSWVPDWSKTELAAPLLSEQLSSGISRAYFTYKEPDMLEVQGIQHTTIKSVSCIASKVEEETLLAVKDWVQDLPAGNYFTGESMETAFILALCMERTQERHPYNHNKSNAEWVKTLHKMLSLTKDSRDDPFYSERETANTIQKIRGRRFFTTENGLIGTAPACTQTSDSICLLLGTYAPMVLRPTSSGTFQVVGECYVYGLSDAVSFLGPLPRPWKAIIKGDALGRPYQLFTDMTNGQKTMDDPRLPLPLNWERTTYERLPEDPALFQKFRNVETGEVINYDPRLTPEALEARGVKLQAFKLIFKRYHRHSLYLSLLALCDPNFKYVDGSLPAHEPSKYKRSYFHDSSDGEGQTIYVTEEGALDLDDPEWNKRPRVLKPDEMWQSPAPDQDDKDHAFRVASYAVGKTVGVARAAQLVFVPISWQRSMVAERMIESLIVIANDQNGKMNNKAVVNFSYGFELENANKIALWFIYRNNAKMVATEPQLAQGTLRNKFIVGGVDHNSVRDPKSMTGNAITHWAPGVGLYVAGRDDTIAATGSPFTATLVAGLVAYIRSHPKALALGIGTPALVKQIIDETKRNISYFPQTDADREIVVWNSNPHLPLLVDNSCDSSEAAKRGLNARQFGGGCPFPGDSGSETGAEFGPSYGPAVTYKPGPAGLLCNNVCRKLCDGFWCTLYPNGKNPDFSSPTSLAGSGSGNNGGGNGEPAPSHLEGLPDCPLQPTTAVF
ncbi:hypothetical protein ACHAQD_008544 [Fusarium lateritium]